MTDIITEYGDLNENCDKSPVDAGTKVFEIRSLGVVRTGFQQQQGTPIQAQKALNDRGVILIRPEFQAGLADLDGFSHIWILYRFNRCREEKLTVIPYLDTVKRGIFATRSPARPNRLGIAVVRLEKVELEQGRLQIAGVDMLDNTPVIDIKPYVPDFDRVDNHKPERIGWYQKSNNLTTKVLADGRFE